MAWRCSTEEAGAAYVSLQTAGADRIEPEAALAAAGVEKAILSVDGAMVPLRQGEWGEVRTLVVGEVAPPDLSKVEWVVHTHHLSYFSRLVDGKQFEHLSLVELHRRGIENSQQVGVVMDGGDPAANKNAL